MCADVARAVILSAVIRGVYGHRWSYGTIHDSDWILREVRSATTETVTLDNMSHLPCAICRVTAIEADRIQEQQKLSNLNYDLEASWQRRR